MIDWNQIESGHANQWAGHLEGEIGFQVVMAVATDGALNIAGDLVRGGSGGLELASGTTRTIDVSSDAVRTADVTVPPPLTGGGLPTDANRGTDFVGENDPNNPLRAFYPDTVHYMSPAESEAHRVFVDGDGLLRKASDGTLLDTTSALTLHSGGAGRLIFVMDGNGNLFASEQAYGRMHHSSLLAGQPVAGAGEIEVHNGVLTAMTDQSGHYRPLPAMNDLVLNTLRQQGLVTDPGFRQYGWHGILR